METNQIQKCCNSCERILPISAFSVDNRSKDGHRAYCLECEKLKKGCNKKLSAFTPRDLIEELAARGYRGKLTYTITKTIIV